MAKRKHRAQHHEEHMDESWLIPYADILTLLLALFIVLFASSQIDQKKFDRLVNAFGSVFSSGSPAILESYMSAPNVDSLSLPEAERYKEETLILMAVKEGIDQYIANNQLTGDLQTALTEDGLLIRIKDSALFTSGSAELLPESKRIGAVIAGLVKPLPQKVIVSGHTDNIPIHTGEFPSNWDLSSKRSLNFMKFLLAEDQSIQPQRFSAIGYGEYQPLDSNETSEGQAKNRRVEVLISRTYRQVQ